MKKSIFILSSVVAFVLFGSLSCEDTGPHVTVKTIESQIYNEIKAHRIANGIPETSPFVHQFVMVKEAQLFSASMAVGTNDVDTTGIFVHWDIIHDKLGGYNDLTLLQSTNSTTAADIVSNWTQDTDTNALILEDFSQCGVGVEYGENQVAYITVLMMKVD
jgi:hypothetical protein